MYDELFTRVKHLFAYTVKLLNIAINSLNNSVTATKYIEFVRYPFYHVRYPFYHVRVGVAIMNRRRV